MPMWAGHSGKVLEEVQQLRRLARRGEERARLSTLIATLPAPGAAAPGVQHAAAADGAQVCISLLILIAVFRVACYYLQVPLSAGFVSSPVWVHRTPHGLARSATLPATAASPRPCCSSWRPWLPSCPAASLARLQLADWHP